MPCCCCATCRERARLLDDERRCGKETECAWEGHQADPTNSDLGRDLEATLENFLRARRDLQRLELRNFSVLANHRLVGATTDANSIVHWAPLMPDTEFHHDWLSYAAEPEGGVTIYTRQCQNCNITYHKVDGDPKSHEGWQKGTPTS